MTQFASQKGAYFEKTAKIRDYARAAYPFGLYAVYSVANYVPLENSDKIGEFRPFSTESAIRCSPIEHYYSNYTIFLALDLVLLRYAESMDFLCFIFAIP